MTELKEGELVLFKRALQDLVHGLSARAARVNGLCVQCRNEPEFYSEAGRKEFGITGLCEFCFDAGCDPVRCANCTAPESWHTHGKTPCRDWLPVEA